MKLFEFNGMQINPDKIDWVGQVISSQDHPHGKFTYSLAGKQFEVRGTADEPVTVLRDKLLALANG